ncbi:MAG: WD40 repeat domain-containing protein, partial [Myxococcota bacterium]
VALLGGRLAVATDTSKLYAGTLERMRAVPDAADVTAVALDPFHADRVAVGASDGAVRVLDGKGATLGAWGVHAGAVAALAFSPDGRLLASAAPRPGAAGARLVVLGTDPDAAADPWSAVLDALPARLAFDAGGTRVLAVSSTTVAVSTPAGLVLDMSVNAAGAGITPDGVRWIDAGGAVRRALPAAAPLPEVPRGGLFARSDDGRFSVTVDGDRVSVWDDRKGRLLRDLPATGQPVRRAVFDDTGDRLAVLGADGAVEVYEVATGEALRNLSGPPVAGGAFTADPWLRFADDGALLWAFAGPRTVIAWEIATGKERERVEIPGAGALALDPDAARGRFVRFVDAAGDVWLDTHAASPKRLTLAADGFRPLAVAPSGKWLLVAQDGGLARLDAATLRRVGPALAHAGDTPGVAGAVSPDGAWIVASYTSGLLRVWEVERGQVATSLGADARLLNRGAAKPVASVAFDDAGEIVTARDATGYPRMWEWRLSTEAAAMGVGAGPVLPSDTVHALAVSPDGKTLYSAHGDWNARAWDLATGAQTNFFWAHAGPVTTLSVAGSRLLTGSEDGTLRGWDVDTAIEKVAMNSFGDPVRHLAATPDGWRAAALGDGGVVRVYDTARGKGLRRWAVAGEAPVALSFPDPNTLYVTTTSGAAWALDPATGAVTPTAPPAAPPPEAPAVVTARAAAAALSPVVAEARTPDGRTLVTAGRDGRIRLWDLETGALRATLR